MNIPQPYIKALTYSEAANELNEFIKSCSIDDICKLLEVKYKPGIDCQEIAPLIAAYYPKVILID